MPAPTITQNIARRTRSRVHLTKATNITLEQYQGRRFTKLSIDDPFVPAISFQPRDDVDEPDEDLDPTLTLEQRLRRQQQILIQSFPPVPIPQQYSWTVTVPAGASIQLATPRLFGIFLLRHVQFYSTFSANESIAWSMAILTQPASNFTEHLAGRMIQPSETLINVEADQLNFGDNVTNPQTVPINQKLSIFAKYISINVTALPPSGPRTLAVHLTLDATL